MADESASSTSSTKTPSGGGVEVTSELDQTRPIGEDARQDELEADRTGNHVVPGDKLGRYMILRPLASGGMAHVYVAFDPELNREVALKVMRPGGPEGRDASGDRLLREAQAMARLEHVNVARVYDVGIVDDRVYMAMELVRGENLEEWLARRKRAWREIVRVMSHAGRGLAAAHAAGLVHLDFKPRNVMVGDDGEIRVVDFGLARPPRTEDKPVRFDFDRSGESLVSGRLTDQITEYGLVMGTPGYMAPEQLLGGLADARTDQFSFCVTMWIALHGQRPFGGKTSSELNAAVCRGQLVPPPSGSHVPAWIRRLLERGLSRRPSARHASMQALLDELGRDPAVRRKKVAALLGVSGLLAAAAWGYSRPGPSSGPSCDEAAEHLEGVWDDGRRAEVVRAFEQDERAFVLQTLEKVGTRLDAYAGAWITMHNDSCRATHKRGEQSTAMLDLRTQCLMERLAELRAVTDLLSVADEEIVEGAAHSVAALPELEACADPARLERRGALPEDSELRVEVEQAQDLVRRSRALSNVGKHTTGLVLISAAHAVAEMSGHLPTITEARLAYSGLLTEYGDSAASEAMAFEGIYAAEQGGLDDRRITGYIDLVYVTGMLQGRADEAKRWSRLAHAAIERVDARPNVRARLLSNEAAIAGGSGEADRSISLYREALSIHEETGWGSDENLASIYIGIGSAHFWRNEYDDSIRYYQVALQIHEDALGTEHPRTATAYENLGAAHHAKGDFAEAYRFFLRAHEVSEGANVAPERLGTLYNGIGAALEGMERYEEAEVWFLRAIEAIDDKGLIIPALGISLTNLGGNLVQQGRASEAIPHYRRGLEVLGETFAPDNIFVRVLECQAGAAYLEVGEISKALRLIAPAIERYEGDDATHDALYRGECRLAFAFALAVAREDALDESSRAAAKGRSAAEWAAIAERDLLAVVPRSGADLRRLDEFRRRYGG